MELNRTACGLLLVACCLGCGSNDPRPVGSPPAQSNVPGQQIEGAAVGPAANSPQLAEKPDSRVQKGARFKFAGRSFSGPLPELTKHQVQIEARLRKDIEELAGDVKERNLAHDAQLRAAAQFVDASFTAAGYKVSRQTYQAKGRPCDNLEVSLHGNSKPEEIVIAGAHYDSAIGTPGANDNASGVAAMLALARFSADKKPQRTLRFVAFVNEEPPHFQHESMGSLIYARRCKQRGEKIVAMLSLETLGYYSDERGSQKYPGVFSMFYPSTGNFIALVGDERSGPLVEDALASFRRGVNFPSEAGVFPVDVEGFGQVPGVGWSDHWSFWQQGYPAIMVTDTALFRYPHYHQPEDTPDKINYDCLARVVAGLEAVVADLAGIGH